MKVLLTSRTSGSGLAEICSEASCIDFDQSQVTKLRSNEIPRYITGILVVSPSSSSLLHTPIYSERRPGQIPRKTANTLRNFWQPTLTTSKATSTYYQQTRENGLFPDECRFGGQRELFRKVSSVDSILFDS